MIHNIFFILIIIATLMFLDFYLTIKGAKLYKLKYSEFIKIDNYELNPMFQKSITDFKYNLRHLLSVVLVLLIVYISYLLFGRNINYNPQSFAVIPGTLFTMFGYVNANHLRNIIIFRAVNKNPEMLKGHIEESHQLSLKTAQAQILIVLIPLLIILLMSPSYFVYGSVLGIIVMYLKLRRWEKKSMVIK